MKIHQLIILFGLIFSQLVFGNTPLSSLIEIQTETEDGAILKGVRLKNPGKPPVLLVHGFTETTRIWREIANDLHASGHDVYMFNMRGHGNGEQRSKVTHPRPGQYGFDHIVSYDIPAMIDFAYQKSGQKITLVGHSMGTMTSRLTISGMRMSDGNMMPFQSAIDWAAHRVKGVMAIASPTQFNSSYPLFKLTKIAPGSKFFLNQFISTVSKAISPLEKKAENSFSRIKRKISELAGRTPFTKAMVMGLINPDNLDPNDSEMARALEKGMSTVHGDLVEDIVRWLKFGYKSRGNNFNYEGHPIPKDMPYVFVVGDRDKLAPPQDIINDYRGQSDKYKLLVVQQSNASHIDLVSGKKAASIMAPFISAYSSHQLERGIESYLSGQNILNIKADSRSSNCTDLAFPLLSP